MERLHRLDDGVWELLRGAGLREVFIGFESGYQPSLDAMGKGASVDHILKCTHSCARHDIDLRGSFMVGIPGIDTKTEIAHTFEMMKRMIDIFHEESDRCVTGLSPLVFCPVSRHPALPEVHRGGIFAAKLAWSGATLTSSISILRGSVTAVMNSQRSSARNCHATRV